MKKRIAIITARGGSKRIPHKNIRDFCGNPIIMYGILAALESELFDVVMVSTDSREIADIAKGYGAEIPFMRGEETSGDFATTSDVIMEVLKNYEEMGQTFETAVCIYPTAPFVTPEKLKEAVGLLEKSRNIEVMPVVKYSYPPQRGYVLENDTIKLKYPEYRDTRSQDLEAIYHDAGQFYCMNVKQFIQCNGKITDGIAPIIVNEMEVQDIDNEEDWKMAELKYRLMEKETT
ncbi:MAG: pseudaminic acid cytidylyltransferase [Lachnospiraceae bacterium]|nr:pseudaminic acid cytidylyltransferase [Lachnospiraceae bacterium]